MEKEKNQTSVINAQVGVKNAHTELIENQEQLNLLIDFCGLIEDKKVKKEMFKKIQPFLRGDDLSLKPIN